MKKQIYIILCLGGMLVFFKHDTHGQNRVKVLGKDTVKLIKSSNHSSLYRVIKQNRKIIFIEKNHLQKSEELGNEKRRYKERSQAVIDSLISTNKIKFYEIPDSLKIIKKPIKNVVEPKKTINKHHEFKK